MNPTNTKSARQSAPDVGCIFKVHGIEKFLDLLCGCSLTCLATLLKGVEVWGGHDSWKAQTSHGWCACADTYVHIHLYTYMCMYVIEFVFTYAYIHIFTYIYRLHEYTKKHIYIYIYVFTCKYVSVRIVFVYIHVYLSQVRMNVHIRTCSKWQTPKLVWIFNHKRTL